MLNLPVLLAFAAFIAPPSQQKAPTYVATAASTPVYSAPNLAAPALRAKGPQMYSWQLIKALPDGWHEVRAHASRCRRIAPGLAGLDVSFFVRTKALTQVLVRRVSVDHPSGKLALSPGLAVTATKTKGRYRIGHDGVEITLPLVPGDMGDRFASTPFRFDLPRRSHVVVKGKTRVRIGAASLKLPRRVRLLGKVAGTPKGRRSVGWFDGCLGFESSVPASALGGDAPAPKSILEALRALRTPYPDGAALTWPDGRKAGRFVAHRDKPLGFAERTPKGSGVCWPLRLDRAAPAGKVHICGPPPQKGWQHRSNTGLVTLESGVRKSKIDAVFKGGGRVVSVLTDKKGKAKRPTPPPANKPLPAVGVRFGRFGWSGKHSIDRVSVVRVFKRRTGALRYCYQKQVLTTHPKHAKRQWTVDMTVTIGTHGRVDSNAVTLPKTLRKAFAGFGGCLRAQVKAWRFAPADGGPMTVTLRATFHAK